MSEQAPLSYIQNYYESVQVKNKAFPEVAEFWLSGFRHVTGKRVLNLGCGPMFYDNLSRFGETPDTYVGLDLNENSFRFLETSNHPSLIEHRNRAIKAGVQTEFIKGDVFEELANFEEPFDTVLGIGFFGTFDPDNLQKLIAQTRNILKPGGRLLKMTWHGAQRTAAEEEEKLKYRYDNEIEPPAQELSRLISEQGFKVVSDESLICPPETVGWHSIQVALYEKTNGVL